MYGSFRIDIKKKTRSLCDGILATGLCARSELGFCTGGGGVSIVGCCGLLDIYRYPARALSKPKWLQQYQFVSKYNHLLYITIQSKRCLFLGT